MDEKAKEKFKWKFYALTILLNVIVLIAAGVVIAYFLAPVSFKLVLPVVFTIIDLVLIAFFIRKYRETKKWLDEHSPKDEATG